MNLMKTLFYPVLAAFTIVFFACGSPEQSSESTETTEEHSENDGHDHGAMESETADASVAPENASVFFVNLIDGEIVTSPFKVEMGVEGINVHPAGELIDGTGHHHILINEGATPAGVAVPADETHIHFGGGQTETELDLAPGVYNITLQFADGLHRSYGAGMSVSIEVEVEEAE